MPQPDYVNAAIAVRTTLAPRALLRFLHMIERRQQRRREPGGPRNAPRTLDLDLLLYGRRRIHIAQLTIPHPRMHERAFTLRPLRDIAPAATLAIERQTTSYASRACSGAVARYTPCCPLS